MQPFLHRAWMIGVSILYTARFVYAVFLDTSVLRRYTRNGLCYALRNDEVSL